MAHGVDAANEEQGPGRRGRFAEPSARPTGRQCLHLVLSGLGGMVISGGVNFGVACVVYLALDSDAAKAVHRRGFRLPVFTAFRGKILPLFYKLPLDAAVTIIVQCSTTWFVESWRTAHALYRRAVQPIGWAGREPSNRLLRALTFLPRDPGAVPAARARVLGSRTFANHLLHGLMLAVVAFIPLWPVAMGLLTLVGDWKHWEWRPDDEWAPPIFKLALGAVLGLLTTPLVSLFWLVRAGWVARHDTSSGA